MEPPYNAQKGFLQMTKRFSTNAKNEAYKTQNEAYHYCSPQIRSTAKAKTNLKH